MQLLCFPLLEPNLASVLVLMCKQPDKVPWKALLPLRASYPQLDSSSGIRHPERIKTTLESHGQQMLKRQMSCTGNALATVPGPLSISQTKESSWYVEPGIPDASPTQYQRRLLN